jgi:toxin ParE1/3/4
MHSHKLIISPIARDDLKNIYQFGIRNWGKTQASNYLDTLKAQFWMLTDQPEMGIGREELLPTIRSFPVENHVIFYRPGVEQIEIIRVLHGRQDPRHHIKLLNQQPKSNK